MAYISFITCSCDYYFINDVVSSELGIVFFILCRSLDRKQTGE